MIFAGLLFYFIGKRFYDLSEEYNQNKWLYAILAIVIYYASQFIFGLILGVLDALLEWGVNWDVNNLVVSLLGIAVGLLSVWGFYSLLKNKWEKSVVVVKDEIHDIGRDIQDEN